jgi:hypothetical protein
VSAAVPSYRVPEGVLLREVDGEMVLLNLASEQYYGLNQVGADMVKRLTSQPEAAALQGLLTDYSVTPEVLQADLDALVDRLVQAGLLLRGDSAA